VPAAVGWSNGFRRRSLPSCRITTSSRRDWRKGVLSVHGDDAGEEFLLRGQKIRIPSLWVPEIRVLSVGGRSASFGSWV
jgi:hypothetical protein